DQHYQQDQNTRRQMGHVEAADGEIHRAVSARTHRKTLLPPLDRLKDDEGDAGISATAIPAISSPRAPRFSPRAPARAARLLNNKIIVFGSDRRNEGSSRGRHASP